MTFYEYMRLASLLFAMIGLAAGMRAAFVWMQASRLTPVPAWLVDEHSIEPRDQTESQAGWIIGMMGTISESGRLNMVAARWTAWTVLFSALASLTGVL